MHSFCFLERPQPSPMKIWFHYLKRKRKSGSTSLIKSNKTSEAATEPQNNELYVLICMVQAWLVLINSTMNIFFFLSFSCSAYKDPTTSTKVGEKAVIILFYVFKKCETISNQTFNSDSNLGYILNRIRLFV